MSDATRTDKERTAPARGGDREPERLTRPSTANQGDKYYVDYTKLPRGYTAEWKRISVFGMQDTQNIVEAHRFHWRPVPHKNQPHILGHLGNDNPEQPIIISGLQLMMRPAYLSEEADAERIQDTDAVLSNQLQALRLKSKDQVGEKFTKIKREYVATSQPVE